MFISPVVREIYFFCKFSPKYQNCLFKMKFSTKTNSNILDSTVMLRFSVFDWEFVILDQICPRRVSWANLVQNYEVVWLRSNLVPGLIQICWIWWYYSFALIWTGNILFVKIWWKNKNFLFFFMVWDVCKKNRV